MKPYPQKPFTDWKQQGHGQYNRPFPLLFDDTLTQLGKMNLLMKLFELLQENFISMQEYMDAVTQFIETEYDKNEMIFQDLKANVESYSERIDNANINSDEALAIAQTLNDSITTAILMVNDIVASGDTNTEVIAARTDLETNERYPNLQNRLDEQHKKMTEELGNKASQSYVDMSIANLVDGTPKELFYSLVELQEKYPNGNPGTYLVFDSSFMDAAHTYMWNGTIWDDLGVYQATHLSRNDLYDTLGLPEPYKVVTLKNINKNGDFSQGTQGYNPIYGTITAEANELTFTITTPDDAARVELNAPNSKNGHIYYAFGFVKPQREGVTRFYVGVLHGRSDATTPANEWTFISSQNTSIADAKMYIRHYASGYQVGETVKFKYLGIMDLTTIFGAGNEPTKEQMDVILNEISPDNKWFNDERPYKINDGANDGKVLAVINGEAKYTEPKDLIVDDNVRYVALNGNDSNNGKTQATPYATLQKALSDEVETIYVQRGIYYQNASQANIKKLTILPLGDSNQQIELRGSDLLNGTWQNHAPGVFKQAYAGNIFYTNVFINKTIAPGTFEQTYKAGLWQTSGDIATDTMLQPVLTIAECEAMEGSFTYDGTNVYVHPVGKTTENFDFHAVKYENVLNLSGDEISLTDVTTKFAMKDPAWLDNIKKIHANNCVASHSVRLDGFSIDKTSGRFVHCKAFKNRNDGFNLHFYGDTVFENCEAAYNYDDGVSHHGNCVGTIIGGYYHHNVSGGVSPVNDAAVNVYNTVLEANGTGLYNPHNAGTTVKTISSNNLYLNNVLAIRNSNSECLSINDKFVGNTTQSGGQTPITIY